MSGNQLKEGGLVAGRVVQAKETAWLKVLRQKRAEFMRSWSMGVKVQNSGASLAPSSEP